MRVTASVDASLARVDVLAGGIRLRYHEVVQRAIAASRSPGVVVTAGEPTAAMEVEEPKQLTTTVTWVKVEARVAGTWVDWFLSEDGGARYLGLLSELRKGSDVVATGRFYLTQGLVGLSSAGNVVIFKHQWNGRANEQEAAQSWLTQIANDQVAWFVDMQNREDMPPVQRRRGETSKRQSAGDDVRQAAARDTSTPPPQRSVPLTLEEEYDAHCRWLRLTRSPPFGDTSVVFLGFLLADFHAQAPETTASLPDTEALARHLSDTTAANDKTSRSDLQPPVFHDNQEMQRYMRWLKMHLGAEVGAVYTPRAIGVINQTLQQLRDEFVRRYPPYTPLPTATPPELENLTVEHLTPKSWTRGTCLLDEFSNANLDPVTLGVIAKGMNTSRSNEPLSFSRAAPRSGTWLPIGPWRRDSPASKQVRAFVARAVVYSSLTYPLVSSNVLGESIERANAPNGNPVPAGIPRYADQFDAVVELVSAEPAKWEHGIAAHCFSRFGVVNPLIVSAETRAALSEREDPLHRLLRARFEGSDLCGTACLRALQRVLNVVG